MENEAKQRNNDSDTRSLQEKPKVRENLSWAITSQVQSF